MKGKIKNDISGDKVFDNWSLLDDIKDRHRGDIDTYKNEYKEYIEEFNGEYYCGDIDRYVSKEKKMESVRAYSLWNNDY